MSATKKIREIFDLTQQQLADYLGVTRSCISMAEGRNRELPTSALIKLAALETSLHNNVQYKQKHLQKQAGKDIAAMRHHAKTCAREAIAVKFKLQKLQNNYQHCLHALMAIDHLQSTLLPGKENRKDELWLELLQARTVKKLNRCSLAAQVKLKLKAQALELQAAQAETMKF